MAESGVLAQVGTWDVGHVSAAVVDADGIVETFGDVDRPYPLASVTKLLFALAVLVAHEERSVLLDDPAGPPGATVRHLLSHASGLPFDGGVPLAPPGISRIYSNRGYEILGEVLLERTEIPAAQYFAEAVTRPLGMAATALHGSPAYSATSSVADLARMARELIAPATILAPTTVAEARTVQFPGLRGVVPGYGLQATNDWGLGAEIRDTKDPHWTGTRNSPATFGHFGRAGTFIWVDPVAGRALVCLTDREFGDWARETWPRLSDTVLG